MARSWPSSCLLNSKTNAIDYCLLQSRNNLLLVCPFLSSPVCCLRGRGYKSVCMRSLCSFYPDSKWPSRIAIIVCQAESAALYGSKPQKLLLIILSVLFSSHIHCTHKTFTIAFSVQIHLFSNFIIFMSLLLCSVHRIHIVCYVNLPHTYWIRWLNNRIKLLWLMALFCLL